MKIHIQAKNIFIGLLVFFIVAYVFFLFLIYNQRLSYDTVMIINDKKIQTFIADNNAKRSAGLSILNTLAQNESMLFLFDKDDIYSFWMKDMNFDIDIVWLNKNKEVVFIKKKAKASDYPLLYTPDIKSHYVAEFIDGFVDKNNIKIGTVFRWNYTL